MPRIWSGAEVEAVVADYLEMLAKEIRGVPYNKAAHRRALANLLDGRSNPSIERKHENISAVLLELDHPAINGYKPLHNYQKLLKEVVERRLAADTALAASVAESVVAPGVIPTVAAILTRMEEAPKLKPFTKSRSPTKKRLTVGLDYFQKEDENSSLGLAGEYFGLDYERARLEAMGRSNLADNIEHIPSTLGDGTGFDIHSYERDGSDRFIEVKTTAYSKHTPFYLSVNEVRASEDFDRRFHLYRLFRFRADPRMFALRGALERACHLRPIQFEARPGARSSA